MKSSQLQKLTFDNMSALLESNDLKAMSEMDVFAATLKWIMYDTQRQQYIRKECLYKIDEFSRKEPSTQIFIPTKLIFLRLISCGLVSIHTFILFILALYCLHNG